MKVQVNYKTIMHYLLIGLGAVVLAFLGALFYNVDIQELYNRSYDVKDIEKQVYELDEVELNGYKKNGDDIISAQNDPQIIIKEIGLYVTDVSVKLHGERKENNPITVYYAGEGEDFSEENAYTKTLKKSKKKIKLPVESEVVMLRIDLGEQEGQSFGVDEIVIKGGKRIFSVKKLLWNLLHEQVGSIFFVRWSLLFFIALFLNIHFVVDLKRMYNWIFDHRWLLGGLFVLLCAIFEIHGDSMSMYDEYVQPGEGSEYVQPIFGKARAIRSDEWVVDTPSTIASSYGEHPYGKYSDVLRGGDTLNAISGVYLSYSSIAKNPVIFVYKLLGVERGFCFAWNFRIVFTLLISMELFYILTRRKKLYSVLGGCLVGLSPFYLWWNFPVFIAGASSVIVCIYYFLIARKKKVKCLYAVGVALGTANFVVNLYPAWQVPVAYVILAFIIWIIHDYWKLIKGMDRTDWTIFFAALMFCCSLIISYFYNIQEYLGAIMHTVYPGKRFDNGGFLLNKIMYYGRTYFYAYKEPVNASESSVFFSLFPIPMIVSTISFVKSKKKDWLMTGLLVVSYFFLIYGSVGLSEVIAKVTLMNYSMPARIIDILGYLNVILMIVCLTRSKVKLQCNLWIAIVIGLGISAISLLVCQHDEADYLTVVMIVISCIMITISIIGLIGNISVNQKNAIWIGLIFMVVCMAVQIRPVMFGFDAFFSKPLADKIEEIVEEDTDGIWLTVNDDIVLQSYCAACGAPTVNTVNTYPNMEIWSKLDPDEIYDHIYNRYAHITVDLVETETSMELIQTDWLKLYLSCKDVEKLGIDYILSRKELSEMDSSILLERMYDENDIYIYRVMY